MVEAIAFRQGKTAASPQIGTLPRPNSNPVPFELLVQDGDIVRMLADLLDRHRFVSVLVAMWPGDCKSAAASSGVAGRDVVGHDGLRMSPQQQRRAELAVANTGTTQPTIGPCAVGERTGVPLKNRLTERQRQVLERLMEGKSNKSICRALNLAEPTVKNHVGAILKALNVKTRVEAVIRVSQMEENAGGFKQIRCSNAG